MDSPDLLISIDDGPEIEEDAKGSRFVGQAFVATTEADARAKLDAVRARYPDATHHCWAFRIGAPEAARERSDDDGEPGRTAGPPILRALIAEEVTDALIVVTRYFGGTKLGKGGLVRAYGSAARTALAAAPRRRIYRTTLVGFGVGYDDLGPAEGLLAKMSACIVAVERTFGERPGFAVTIHASEAPNLVRALSDATAGRVRATIAPTAPTA